ncbi:MAG: cell division FtsA domain-containing protein [Patescibacteria group bacterium]|jgi:cell division protein FtsA
MMWGRKTSPKPQPQLILDLGTSTVKAILVYVEDNEVHVVGRAYVKYQPNSLRGGVIVDLNNVAQACREAIDLVSQQAKHQPKATIIGVSGQLVESVTTTVHYDRANPEQALDATELKNIIYKIQQRSIERLRTVLREKFTDAHPDVELIHAAVVDVQLDGYTVANPIGFQGKRLTLTIFNAYIPLVYASMLQELTRQLGLQLISIAAQPYGMSKILVKKTLQDYQGIFIDVGHTTTDVVVVKHGSVEGMQNFAFGGQAFSRAIQKALKTTPERAEKIKLDHSGSKLNKKSADQVSEALLTDARIWLAGVELALKEFSDLKLLPSRIYLTGGSATIPELRRVLLTKDWTTELPFSSKPYPEVIAPDTVDDALDEIGVTWSPQDLPTLGLAKLLLDLTPDDDIVTAMLQSIVRSMKGLS